MATPDGDAEIELAKAEFWDAYLDLESLLREDQIETLEEAFSVDDAAEDRTEG
jgi:hypothetical protein